MIAFVRKIYTGHFVGCILFKIMSEFGLMLWQKEGDLVSRMIRTGAVVPSWELLWGFQKVETMDMAKHPVMHRTAPPTAPTKNYLA